MVADVHRILSRGGIFLYPWDKREPEKPGKLRLMYEANPMAFIVEQAGGLATDGRRRILDLVPTKLHERVSVVLGSKNEVQRVTDFHRPRRRQPLNIDCCTPGHARAPAFAAYNVRLSLPV